MKVLKMPTTSSRSCLSSVIVTKVRTVAMLVSRWIDGMRVGSARGEAGVDGQGHPGHVRGVLRAQPQARLRHLLGLPEAAEEADDGGELRLGHADGLERPAHHRGVDRARADGV